MQGIEDLVVVEDALLVVVLVIHPNLVVDYRLLVR